MCFFHDHRRPGLSWFESSRSGLWSIAALIIASLAPWASAVAVDPPQTQEENTSSSPPYAELLPAEPQDSQPTIEEIEQELRRNSEIHQPYMIRTDFVQLCRKLALNEAQAVNLSSAFDAYEQRLQKLHEEHMDRVVPVILEYVRISQEEADGENGMAGELVVAAGKAVERQRKKNNELLQHLHRAVQVFLREDQLKAHASGLRAWRRSFMLNPGESGGFGRNLVYHVDLFEVIDQACQDEPALLTLLDRQAEDPSHPALAEARRKCLELLETFELELDALIQRRFRRTWDRSLTSMQAWADGDDQAAQRTRRKHRRDWMKVYRANTHTAETLALIIQESCGDQFANAWREYYYEAYYPALYRPKSTDLLYEWLTIESGLSAELQPAIEAIYAQYLESRRALRARTRSMLLGLTKELNLSSPVMIAVYEVRGTLPPKKAQLDQQRRTLSEQTNLHFRNILSGEQQAAFDQALQRFQRRGFDHQPLEF